DGFSQNPQPRAASYALRFKIIVYRGEKSIPGTDSSRVFDDLRPIGVVHSQYRRLSGCIRRTETSGMIGIAFDLGWPSFMTLDQNSGAGSIHWKRGSKKQRPAGDDLLRLIHIRHDLLIRWSCSTGIETCECQRGAH